MSSGQRVQPESLPFSALVAAAGRRRRAAPSSTAAGEGEADEAGWSRSRGLHSSISESIPERALRSRRRRRCGGPALAIVVVNLSPSDLSCSSSEVTNHTTYLFLQQEIHCTHRLRGVVYPSLWPSDSCREPLDVSNNFSFGIIDGILSDFSKVFKFKFVHLGGDEVNTSCCTAIPHIKKRLDDNHMNVSPCMRTTW